MSTPPLINESNLAAMGVVGGDARVNVFIHGYRSMASVASVDRVRLQIAGSGAVGENLLLRWGAGEWGRSLRSMGSTLAGLRAAYRVARVRNVFVPWMILVDAGVLTFSEVAQFKLMERRAERVGRELPALLAERAEGRPVNLIGHSLGARVVHFALATTLGPALAGGPELSLADAVFLGGAADTEAADWPDCLARLSGRLYNAYSPRDPILRITPDLRRRVGGGPMPPVSVDGVEKVVNHRCYKVGHVTYWTELARLLPEVWPNCRLAKCDTA